MRKYHLDENFFSNNNEMAASIAGFIAADGCITTDNRCLQIQISNRDLILLKQIRKNCNSNHKILTYNKNKTAQINFRSVKLVADLNNNYNITPKKTLTYKPQYRNCKLLDGAFIVGLIIGDGWITIKKSSKYHKKNPMIEVGICGTYDVCDYVKNYKDKYFPSSQKYSAKVRLRKNKNCFQYTVAGKSALDMLEYLNSLNTLKLPRKFNKIKQFKSNGRFLQKGKQ